MPTRPRVLRYVGLDVHAETIAVAVAERAGDVRALGVIPNRPEAIRKMVHHLGPVERLRVCYEAGPCGYVLYWLLTRLGIHCDVVAPTLVPIKAGDRVKTDRRDALKLARAYRAGDLTAVWVPTAADEALRDLVRAREAAKKDQLRARHRLAKFLLRHGRMRPTGMRAWTQRHEGWLAQQRFAHAAQAATYTDYVHEVAHAAARLARLAQALETAVAALPAPQRAVVTALATLRGVALLGAVSLVSELGTFARFAHPRQLMGYSGVVPREYSSGARTHRGSITKTGNAHVRRILGEAAWAYRHGPSCTGVLKRRQAGQPPAVRAVAWAAQHRLCARYRALQARGKPQPQIIIAIARELLGFLWAIGTQVEQAHQAVAA
jgi:transposase